MKEITVTTQAELDALPDSFSEPTIIKIKVAFRKGKVLFECDRFGNQKL